MKLHMVTVKKRFNTGNYEYTQIEASAYPQTTETLHDVTKKLDQQITYDKSQRRWNQYPFFAPHVTALLNQANHAGKG